jgi:hypothetical protein
LEGLSFDRETARWLPAMVKCEWESLDKYFSLTGRAPVYIAAVVLHPERKWQYFNLRWKPTGEWIVPAKKAVEALGNEGDCS